MRKRNSLVTAVPSQSGRGRMPAYEGLAFGLRPAGLPEVPGVLTADQLLATGRSIAAMQQPSGAIGWPDGHADAWNHVECAMALTTCGLTRSEEHTSELQ